MTDTTTTDYRISRIENTRQHLTDTGRTIHEADTPVGHIMFTLDGLDATGHNVTGHVLAASVKASRIDHIIDGTYTLRQGTYDWHNGRRGEHHPDMWTVSISGYNGIERVDRGTVTDKARQTIERAIGAAIAEVWTTGGRAEAERNEREQAARRITTEAEGAEAEAARLLEKARKLYAQATDIRNGRDYPTLTERRKHCTDPVSGRNVCEYKY